jgi:hypothetical protein
VETLAVPFRAVPSQEFEGPALLAPAVMAQVASTSKNLAQSPEATDREMLALTGRTALALRVGARRVAVPPQEVSAELQWLQVAQQQQLNLG